MTVQSLWIHPVKACAGVRVDAGQVTPRGFRGDRRWMLVDSAGRHFTQREAGALALVRPRLTSHGLAFEGGPRVHLDDLGDVVPVTIWGDPVQARPAPEEVSAWISRQADAELRLVYQPDGAHRPVDPAYGKAGDEVSLADGYPFLLVTTGSLSELNRRLPRAVPMRRFRPNIVIEREESFAEDTWRRVRVGEVELEVVKPCERCVVIDTDPATGERKNEVLKALSAFRRVHGKVYFGQNGIARTPGVIREGDAVQVLESGPARPELPPAN